MKKLMITSAMLWCCLTLTAQTPATPEQLRQGFDTWRKYNYTEKTFVQTDKQDYLAGELIWWSFFCVNGSSLQPSGLSKIGYVEILDASGRPVLQGKTALDLGLGRGSFFVPVSLGTGSYELRAYTKWMRNNDSRYFFRKKIQIINPFRAVQAPVALNHNRFTILARPEAGKLISGVPTRVALLLEGPADNKSTKGWLLNEKGDSIQSLETNQYGLGIVRFTPIAAQQYSITLTLPDGSSSKASLPTVQTDGAGLSALANNNGGWQVEVTGNLAGKTAYLFLQNRQAVQMIQTVNNTMGSLTIPATVLGEGINQLSLVDNNGQVLAERLLYQQPKASAIQVNNLAATYRKRQEVTIQAGGLPAFKNGGRYTIAVNKETVLDKTTAIDMQTWWWLGADLSFTSNLLQQLPLHDAAQLEPLLLLSEGRPFALGVPAAPAYSPEYDGQQLTVKLSDAATGRVADSIPLQLAITGGKPQYYMTTSNRDGICHFDIHDFYGNGTLVFRVDKAVKSGYKFEPEYSFAPSTLLPTEPVTTALPASLATDLTAASFALQVRNQYTADSLNFFTPPMLDSLSFYGKAANSYMLDKFVRFTTIEEVLREYVLEVAVRFRDGKPQLFMIDQTNRGLYSSEPLVLVDGIPCSGAQALALDPLKIMRLDVVDHRYVFGDYLYDGVVSFVSYDGSGLEMLKIPDAGIFEMEGLQIDRQFHSVNHGIDKEENERIPDYRSLLYWQTTEADKNGNSRFSFYTGDIPGRYKVTIEGTDHQGHSGKTVQYFEIIDK